MYNSKMNKMCNISYYVSCARLWLSVGISWRDRYIYSSKFVEASIPFQSPYFSHCPSLSLTTNKYCDHCRYVLFRFVLFLDQYSIRFFHSYALSDRWCYKSSILAITLCEGNVNIHKRNEQMIKIEEKTKKMCRVYLNNKMKTDESSIGTKNHICFDEKEIWSAIERDEMKMGKELIGNGHKILMLTLRLNVVAVVHVCVCALEIWFD